MVVMYVASPTTHTLNSITKGLSQSCGIILVILLVRQTSIELC